MNKVKFTLLTAISIATVLAFLACEEKGSTFTDTRDGKKYRIVKIGEQTWMAENLNFKTGNSWCFSDNEDHCKERGRLYDWETAVKACPSGWHLSSLAEWQELAKVAGGEGEVAASKLRRSFRDWCDIGSGSFKDDEEFGFSALPGGFRNEGGSFDKICSIGNWWSADRGGEYIAPSATLWHNDFRTTNDNKRKGLSVRCVQDGSYKAEAEAPPTEEATEAAEAEQVAEVEQVTEEAVAIDEEWFALMKEIIHGLPDSLLWNNDQKREDVINSHYRPEEVNRLYYGFREDYCENDWDLAAYLMSDQENAVLMIQKGGGCDAYGINFTKTLNYHIATKKITEIPCPLDNFTAEELSPEFSDAAIKKRAKAYFTDAYFRETIQILHGYRRDGFTASPNLYFFCEGEENCDPSKEKTAYRKWNGSRFVKAELPPEKE